MTDKRNAHFTYVWVIENASKVQFSTSFLSPVFCVDVEGTKSKWHLTIDLTVDWLTFFIRRVEDDGGPDVIEIDYEISLLSVGGYPLTKMMDRKRFKNSSNYALRRVAKSEVVFNVRKYEFLHKDNLTVQCKIWKTGLGTAKGDLLYVRTMKRVEHISFVWAIKNFNTFRQNVKRIHIVNTTSKVIPQLILTFYLEKLGDERAFIQIEKTHAKHSYTIRGYLCILDVNRRIHYPVKIEEYVSLNSNFNLISKSAYPKNQLVANKESLLPNDVLTFKCEFEIDADPFCFLTEKYEDFQSSDLKSIVAGVPEIEFNKVREASGTDSQLEMFLTECYKQEILSDVCFRVGPETFSVHKLVLSAYSSVFKAMFIKDTQEKTSGCIDIPDVDADTMRLMLFYVYSKTVPELQWESAVDLFAAADKYDLVDLKEKCSEFLRINISVSNCCNIITVADRHHDDNLRKMVLNFMMKHNAEIFRSDQWKTFKSNNFVLAMDSTERIISLMKSTVINND